MFLLYFTCACFAVVASGWSEPPFAPEYADYHFERFIEQYERQYADENEKQAKFLIFKENLEKIMRMNENTENAIFGMTMFMDMTVEQFQSAYTGLLKSETYEQVCDMKTDADIPHVDAPESFDWRHFNAVTPVKDQGFCGSCYAFSAIGNIESQIAIKHKQVVDLSEQQIVDCDRRSAGCWGGLMSYAFRELIDEGGSKFEADYPYHGKKEQCHLKENSAKVKLANCISYNLTSQEKLKQLLVHNGPISIAIAAKALHSLLPHHIVTDKHCTGDINHGVLLVGYGTENGMPYWIVKNSWGIEKGGDGYFRMQRGEGAWSCGVMNSLMATAIIA